MDIVKFITIDSDSRVPKYKQIVDSIIYNISNGNIKVNQKIPSINLLSEEFNISRETVVKAYSILKDQKVITSFKSKGFYTTKTTLISKVNILFLLNKFSSYKIAIYKAFINSLGANSHTDLQIYHCDESLFLNLIESNKGAYDYYVIMPHFKNENLLHSSYTDDVLKAIKKLPKERIVILDNKMFDNEESIAEIYQDFENDIYNALTEGLSKIRTYNKSILIYPENAEYPYPRRILYGFKKFCIENNLSFEIHNQIPDNMVLKKGDLYITIEESDLVNLLKQIRDAKITLGKDIGVISYNDTPLKDLLGITVISTDFNVMGETAAKMIQSGKKEKIKVPFNFIDRNSI